MNTSQPNSPTTEKNPELQPKTQPIQINIKTKRRGIISTASHLAVNTEWQRWSAFGEIKNFWRFLLGAFKDLTMMSVRNTHSETFAEALVRLNITEQDLKMRNKKAIIFGIFYLTLAIVLFVYAIFLAVTTGLITATFVSLVLSVMAFTFAGREHFWHTQIKHRKLGLTFKDWMNLTFKTENK